MSGGRVFPPAAAISEPLRSVAGRAREPVRKTPVRNDFTNPRGVGRASWAHADTGLTNVVWDDLDDPAFVPGPGYGANGHCVRIQADYAQGVGWQEQIDAAFDGVEGLVATASGQLVYGRARVKVVSCPADSTVVLLLTTTSNTGGPYSGRTVATRRVNPGDVFDIEGFRPSLNTRATAVVQLSGSSAAAGHIEIRVGCAQIVIEPEGDVPGYVDGYAQGAAWSGAADASSSSGVATPVVHDRNFRGGANMFQWFSATDRPLSAAQIADLHAEAGFTHVRHGLNPAEAWPSQAMAAPDWTLWSGWPMIAELRKRGLKLLTGVGGAPSWMTTDGSTLMSKVDLTNFRAQYELLATSFFDVAGDVCDCVEVYNEPNLLGFVDAGLTADVYTARMVVIYNAIKAKYPDVTVIGGVLGRWISDDVNGISVQNYLTQMYANGAKGKMDAISVHPYTDDASTALSLLGSTGNHSGFDQVLTQARTARHAAGDDATPLWVTEFGISGVTERAQMQAVSLWRGILARSPDVKAAFVHTLTNGHGTGRSFEMVDSDDLRRKATFEAIKRSGVGPGARWRTAALQNSWVIVNAGVGFPTALRYRRDGDLVTLRGFVQKTTGAPGDVITTLPDGFLPFDTLLLPVGVFNGAAPQMGLLEIIGRSNPAGAGNVFMNVGGSIAAGSYYDLCTSFFAEG